MRQYKIYKHPSGTTVAVKQGWSWPAFFFDIIWALVKKMWKFGFSLIAAFIAFGLILGFAGAENAATLIINFIAFIMKIAFGKFGNNWLADDLKTRGYEYLDTVTAANQEGAIALFMKAQNQNI